MDTIKTDLLICEMCELQKPDTRERKTKLNPLSEVLLDICDGCVKLTI